MISLRCGLIFLLGIIHVSNTEIVFEDGFDEIPNGRPDVETNLNLSPWELYVVGDLIFKLTTTQCPHISKGILKGLHEAVSQTFKQAPRPEIQNEEFLPVYSKLVRCLDYVHDKTDKDILKTKHTIENLEDDNKNDIDSTESDWAQNDEPLPPSTTEISKEVDTVPNWFTYIHGWVSEFLKSAEEKNKEAAKKKEIANQSEHLRQKDILFKRAKQNFAKLLHEMSKIVRKSCPKPHRPDTVFMRKTLQDMITWVTLDQHDVIAYAALYFRKHGLVNRISDCAATI